MHPPGTCQIIMILQTPTHVPNYRLAKIPAPAPFHQAQSPIPSISHHRGTLMYIVRELSYHLASCHTCTCHIIVITNFVVNAIHTCETLNNFSYGCTHMFYDLVRSATCSCAIKKLALVHILFNYTTCQMLFPPSPHSLKVLEPFIDEPLPINLTSSQPIFRPPHSTELD